MWVELSDVQGGYEKPIPQTWNAYVNHQIGRAERRLKRKLPQIEGWITTGCLDVADVKDVVIEAVLRVIRNPGGLQMEMEGNYSAQMRADVAGGKLYFSDDELDQLRACASSGSSQDTPYIRPFRIGIPASRWRP